MQSSGVQAAIRELEGDVKRVQEVLGMLKKIQSARVAKSLGAPSGGRRLSAKARKRISEAAKKRWAAFRANGSGKRSKA
jgi:hypothetical protein